jgi:hypothetical protein
MLRALIIGAVLVLGAGAWLLQSGRFPLGQSYVRGWSEKLLP